MEDEPSPNIIQDFWFYCQHYEITRNMATWSILGALSATVNRKIYTKIGDIYIDCKLYILLVGEPGTGKSTAMDFAKQLFVRACPEIPIGPSKQSHGDIIKFMSSDECYNSYTDEKGVKQTVRAYIFFIDEFKNFVAYDIIGMISFLTGIYGVRDKFDASTIARGREDIDNPSLCFVACENPSWMIRHIKNDSISDGLGRRVIIVYETSDAEPRPKVTITAEARAARDRIVASLVKLKNFAGEYILTEDGQVFYNDWYIKNRERMKGVTDLVFKGYLRSKHTQLLKVCMLYDAASGKPTWKISADLLQIGLAFLDSIEPNIPKLFISAGRNELAAPQQRIIELIESYHGILPERELLKITAKDLSPTEQISVLGFLKQTQQIYKVQYIDKNKVERWVYMTPKAMEENTVNIKQKG